MSDDDLIQVGNGYWVKRSVMNEALARFTEENPAEMVRINEQLRKSAEESNRRVTNTPIRGVHQPMSPEEWHQWGLKNSGVRGELPNNEDRAKLVWMGDPTDE